MFKVPREKYYSSSIIGKNLNEPRQPSLTARFELNTSFFSEDVYMAQTKLV